MTFRGFLLRTITILLTTWILGSIIDSVWWGLYYAVVPFIIYEMVRPR